MAHHIEQNQAGEPEIVIDGWEFGIAPSAQKGLQDVRNVNIEDTPGIFQCSPQATSTAFSFGALSTSFAGFSLAFTADATADTVTIATNPTSMTGTFIAVTFSTSGTLPAPFVVNTVYYLVYQSGGIPLDYKVATSHQNAYAGTFVNITTTGTGTQTATSINMGNMTTGTIDPGAGITYTVDSNGRVWGLNYLTSGWSLIDGNTLTATYGNGIAIFHDWLFVFRGHSIDVYGPLNGGTAISSRAWYNGWKTMNAGIGFTSRHDSIVGQDDTLYWTDFDDTTNFNMRGYIGSLRPRTGQLLFQDTGNPTTSSSSTNYSYNNQTLDFPLYEKPAALEEQGLNLVIGVNFNYSSPKGYSKIYTWDRISATFSPPLFLPETPISDLINNNETIYIFAGSRGRIYKTNFSSIELAVKIPDSLFYSSDYPSNTEGDALLAQALLTFSDNVCVCRRKIFFGINGSFAGGTALYSYDPVKNVLKIENQASIGNYGLYFNPLKIPCVISGSDGLTPYYSWGYNATPNPSIYGWDYSTLYGYSTSTFFSYVVTDLIPVGTLLNRKTFGQVEWKTDTALGSSDQVRISYRFANNKAWTVIGTTSYSASNTSQFSDYYDSGIENAEWVQFKIELSSINQIGATGVRFKELRIR